MITNYNDPRVTLKQVYKGVTAGQTALLGACIIGPHYSVRTYLDFGEKLKVIDAYSEATTSYTAKLLKGTEPANVVQDTVKLFVVLPIIRKFSELNGKITSGNKLLIGLDAVNEELLTNIKTGWIVSISSQDSENTVDYTILATNRKSGVMVVTLNKKATNGDVKFSINAKGTSGYIDKACYKQTNNTLNVTIDMLKEATIADLVVVSGTLYTEYSEYNNTFVKKHGYCAGVDSVEDTLGKVCPLNPLAIAVSAACRNAGDNFVFFIAVDQQRIDKELVTAADLYMRAADIVALVAGCYGITPCTDDKTVLQNLIGSANEMSAELIPHFKYVYGSALFTRTLTDRDDDANDTNTDLMILNIIKNKAFSDKRGMLVVADNARYLGQRVPNYVVAAAVAGLRSNKEPQAPLSNVSLAGITTDDDSGFTYSQSKLLGANGFCRVGMNNGLCIIRRQLTSAAVGDVNYDLQSIVCVIDAICLRLKTIGRSLVGNSNISQSLIDLLSIDLNMALSSFTSQTDPYIGPMLLSATLVKLEQDSIDKSRIVCSISGLPPKPFNLFAITFYMN